MVPFCLKALMKQPVPDTHHYRYFGNAICDTPMDPYFRVKTIGWWGMTETVGHGIVGSAFHPDGVMSMGRPSLGYRVHVLRDDGTPAGPGEVGDLLIDGVRGVSLFLEYAGDPAATAAAFREDGLFVTGDRVRVGADGCLYFADRSKDMLKVGGENVAASEIERVIGTVGGVAEVAVVGMPHDMLDEVPVAFVIAHPGSEAGIEDAVLAACADQLAVFKRPHQVRRVDSFPRATLEKVAKAELRAQLLRER